MLTVCGECVGKQAADSERDAGDTSMPKLSLVQNAALKGRQSVDSLDFLLAALLGMLLSQRCLLHKTPR